MKTLSEYILEDSFNIKNVYHVSGTDFEAFRKGRFGYFFFSDKPIKINGSKYTYICDISMHKPFVFAENAGSWGYPLWLYLTDDDGNLVDEKEFTKRNYDGYMGCPFEFWKMIYYDKDEYLTDEIPYLVKNLHRGYDGVIIKNIEEGDDSVMVDDYIVFDEKQIRIVKKIKN